ncbi:hypothetical protein CPB84DRAFT_1758361 [Gymnopilus junonius]|uniref:Uncharacterized protein n=1 Tax=Gymnopilus junonius TaxID=109634 RepID=A0A9P5P4A7_GYMJU|nr:hypothetical protein CPB84DRAFT_1758361 [Gymnopilus junonius]
MLSKPSFSSFGVCHFAVPFSCGLLLQYLGNLPWIGLPLQRNYISQRRQSHADPRQLMYWKTSLWKLLLQKASIDCMKYILVCWEGSRRCRQGQNEQTKFNSRIQPAPGLLLLLSFSRLKIRIDLARTAFTASIPTVSVPPTVKNGLEQTTAVSHNDRHPLY